MNQTQSTHAGTVLCPYCGHLQPSGDDHCETCQGLFEPLSRMATQIAMGPWFVRDDTMPYAPGCSYQIIKRKAQVGKLTAQSIIRGPSTHQFWMHADQVPGIAHLIGICHQCGCNVQPTERLCHECHATFDSPDARNEMGLQYPNQEAAHQARVHLEQLKAGSNNTPPETEPVSLDPVIQPPPPTPAIQSKVDNVIRTLEPVAASVPLPDSSELIPGGVYDSDEPSEQPTHSIKTADLNKQAQHLSATVIIMIVCITVLLVLIVMLYIGSRKPGGVTGQSPIPRELGTTGALRQETLPKVADDTNTKPAAMPDPVGSLDLHQIISDARSFEQQGQSDRALARLKEYAQTLGDGKLPFDLETEIKRIEQKIAREKAASFFRSGD